LGWKGSEIMVNLETDIIGKFIERLMKTESKTPTKGSIWIFSLNMAFEKGWFVYGLILSRKVLTTFARER
jgi:hypothetical protein